MTDLHQHPPMTMGRVHARQAWILPVTAVLFVLLAIGAAFDALPWDKPIYDAVIDARTPWLETLARRVSFFGSTRVVFPVAAIAALLAWRRCPRLALAIVVIVVARPAHGVGAQGAHRPRSSDRRRGWFAAPDRRFRAATRSPPRRVGGSCRSSPRSTRSAERCGGASQSQCGRSRCWSRPAGWCSASTGRPTWSPACCSRSSGSPPPSGSSRPRTHSAGRGPDRGEPLGSIAVRCDFRESNDVELELVDHASLRGSRGTAGDWSRPSTASARRGSGRRRRGSISPTRSEFTSRRQATNCASTISLERLTAFAALDARVDHDLDLRVASDRFVRRQRGFAQRDHCEDTDRHTRRPRARAGSHISCPCSCPVAGAPQELADLDVVGTRHVLREDGDVVEEQAAARIADRSERTREPLFADRCRRLRSDSIDDPRDPGEEHTATDEEGDEDVGSARPTPSARRTGPVPAVASRAACRGPPGRPRACARAA